MSEPNEKILKRATLEDKETETVTGGSILASDNTEKVNALYFSQDVINNCVCGICFFPGHTAAECPNVDIIEEAKKEGLL